jgi:hypothetical protein
MFNPRPSQTTETNENFGVSLPSEATFSTLADFVLPQLVGIPLMVSYDSSWSCSRIRYQLWLNSLRLFNPESPYLQSAHKALDASSGGLVEQFRLSDQLDLHFVEASGNPIYLQQQQQQQQPTATAPEDPSAGTTEEDCSESHFELFEEWLQKVWNGAKDADNSERDMWLDQCFSMGKKEIVGGSDSLKAVLDKVLGVGLVNSKHTFVGSSTLF